MSKMSKIVVSVVCLQASMVAGKASRAGAFMLASGITSSRELCILEKTGSSAAGLAPCNDAATSMDAGAVWQMTSTGRLSALGSQQCLGAGNVGDAVTMVDCTSSNAAWEFTADGQLKTQSGNACLVAKGGSGRRNLASHASVVASSTANAAHGATLATDGKEASYWASRFDESNPVTVTVDLGTAEIVDYAEIDWAFVPTSFSLELSADGSRFDTVYSTDANIVGTTRVNLAGQSASKARITMKQAHPLTGQVSGRAVYGIKSIVLSSGGPSLATDDCSRAAASVDARDKFFMSGVGEFDPAPANAYKSELPSLEAAMTSLSATVAELAAVVPHIADCSSVGNSLVAVGRNQPSTSQMGTSGAIGAEQVLEEARATIIEARKALA